MCSFYAKILDLTVFTPLNEKTPGRKIPPSKNKKSPGINPGLLF